MIALSAIERLYRTEEVETAALSQIALEISQGEFVAVTGPSGCGKSTLLNVIGMIDRPTAGRYMFHDQDISAASERTLAGLRARHLGFIFQTFNLIDELTITENVELGLVYRRTLSGAERRIRVAEAMDRVGIAHRARHFPYQLSGGQQQRAAIARAIVGHPELILADEPTGNLDSRNGSQVMDILQGLNAQGATLVMVTHSPAHADMAGRVVEMLDGRIVADVRRIA
jgi:putative ABC transport system ATP-binding protein